MCRKDCMSSSCQRMHESEQSISIYGCQHGQHVPPMRMSSRCLKEQTSVSSGKKRDFGQSSRPTVEIPSNLTLCMCCIVQVSDQRTMIDVLFRHTLGLKRLRDPHVVYISSILHYTIPSILIRGVAWHVLEGL